MTLYTCNFVDLRKSVPREAVWRVMEKCGVPPKLLRIVKSCHEGMQAEVRVGQLSTECFDVQNGLRQRCTLAPTLFNIYISTAVTNWKNRHREAGIDVLYKHGRKLVSDRTAKSRLNVVRVTETQFADDAALYATSREAFESVAAGYEQVASDFGLKLSVEKTKRLIVKEEVDLAPVQVQGGSLDIVEHFPYLGSNISCDGEVTVEISSRIAKACRAFGCLRRPVFQDRNLSIATKRLVYKAAVLSILLYGAETWTLKAPQIRQLNSFHKAAVSEQS